jgi:hypothetical protein
MSGPKYNLEIRLCSGINPGPERPHATRRVEEVWSRQSGRSVRDLIMVLNDFKERGIKFRSLTENIETETPTAALCGT